MKIYKVSMSGDFGHADSATRWTSRKADIPSLKRELYSLCNDRETRSVESTTVDVIEFLPTVSGIIQMLNSNAR